MTHPLDLRVVGEHATIVGSPDGWKLAPSRVNGARVEVMRPSSIAGFVIVWDAARGRTRQVHVSCLREDR